MSRELCKCNHFRNTTHVDGSGRCVGTKPTRRGHVPCRCKAYRHVDGGGTDAHQGTDDLARQDAREYLP